MDPVFASLPDTIFDEMSGLSRRHGAINLGQGFPDGPGPEDIRARAAEALMGGLNQYPPMRGLPELRDAICAHYALHQGLDLGVDEVIVTSGGSEALSDALMAVLSPGDEVVLFEPTYDLYLPVLRRAGAVARFVKLEPPGWRISEQALADAITERTRLVVLNNPHNPAGRNFDAEELGLIAAACVRHDLLALSDEVWEHIRFDGKPFLSLMALPGMRERTIKVGSGGKIFSMTGWKVGWVCAAPALIDPVSRAHQYMTFTTAPALQAAFAWGLAKPPAWFDQMRAGFQRSRDRLAAGLTGAGFAVLPSEATYFLCLDLAASGLPADDDAVCRRWVAEAGVGSIPVSALCPDQPVRNVVRLCFAKSDAVLDQAVERLDRARRLF